MQQAAYDWTRGAMNIVWLLMPFALPFVLMHVVVRVFRWAHRLARRQDGDDLVEDYYAAREATPATMRRLERATRSRSYVLRERPRR